jgi:subtilisin family serine protease
MWKNPNEIPGNGLDDDNNGMVDDVFGFNAILGNGNITDDNGHGTHVAGTIGAVGNNGLGVSGVSWSVNLMAVKSLGENGGGLISDIAEGILYAVDQGADVINASLESPFFQNSIKEAIEYAEENNVIFVAAAGNEGNNNDGSPRYPASYDVPNIVAVASLEQSGELSSFSNFGKSSVDIAAPGGDILSTHLTSSSSYASLNGTSMAAPHVSGVLALLIQEFPDETYSRYIDRLYQGGFPLKSVGGVVSYSSGLDLAKSLSIQDPPSDLRFTSQMPNPLIRFQFQDLELTAAIEDDSNASYTWLKDGQEIESSGDELLLENLKLDDSGNYSLRVEKSGQQIRDVSNMTVIAG